MTKSKIFFILSASFLGGVGAASFFYVDKSYFLILLAGALAFFIVNYGEKKYGIVLAAAVFLIAGAWRTNSSLNLAKDNLASQKLGQVEFVGMVSQDPEADERSQKIIITLPSEGAVRWYKKLFIRKEKALVSAEIYPKYSYGDELKIACTLQAPKNYEDSGFDYQMYLAKDRIFRICNKPQITLVGKSGENKFYALIISAKNKFEEKLSKIFPDPEGAYLKGLLLGGSKRMTSGLSDAFQRTGTTHTVAVSGYNVTIVAAFFMWAGIWLGLWRQQVFSFALIGIVLFVLMTGAPSSAVRAGIMGSLVIWAMKEGRLASSTNAILLAGSLMLAINPLLFRYDAGFQLSFLATLGIIYLYPLFEKKFQKGTGLGMILELLLLTIAAQIFVMPVILNSFGKLSLVSPAANILILPAIPVIMGWGFAAGIAGFIFVPLGKLVGFVPYILLKMELLLVQLLGNLPWASVEVKNFGWKYILAYYLALLAVLFFMNKKNNTAAENEK